MRSACTGGISKAGGKQSVRERILIFMWNRLLMQASLTASYNFFQPAKNGMFLSGADNNLKVYACVYILSLKKQQYSRAFLEYKIFCNNGKKGILAILLYVSFKCL